MSGRMKPSGRPLRRRNHALFKLRNGKVFVIPRLRMTPMPRFRRASAATSMPPACRPTARPRRALTDLPRCRRASDPAGFRRGSVSPVAAQKGAIGVGMRFSSRMGLRHRRQCGKESLRCSPRMWRPQECSSAGRAPVSKTGCRRFEPGHSCHSFHDLRSSPVDRHRFEHADPFRARRALARRRRRNDRPRRGPPKARIT